MKIKINGIFHKYNNVIDLDKRISIYIGENGVGKTTTMNILYCILTGNFIDILKYNFESIDIDDIHINYDDLIPDISDITNYARQENTNDERLEMFDCTYVFKKIDKNLYIELFKEIAKKGKIKSSNIIEKLHQCDIFDFGDISYIEYSILLYFKQMSNEMEFILYKSSKNGSYEINTFDFSDNDFDNYSKIKFLYCSKIYDIEKLSINYTNKLYERLDSKLKKYYTKLSIKYSMLDEISFINNNEKNNKDVVYSPFVSDGFCTKNNNDDFIKMYYNYIKEKTPKYIVENELYIDYSINSSINKKEIELNKLIINYFYGEDFFKNIFKDFYSFILENGDIHNDIKSPNILSKEYYSYIINLLPTQMLDYIRINHLESSNKYNLFITTEIEKIVNYTNSKLEKLNKLLNKYFKNKKIIICPSGIVVSLNNKFENDIDIEDLSEGERRLLLLLILSVIDETKVLILDELEASLSIVWQETILNDLIENSNVENIIVATQSPYIVPEELYDDIICLPGE